jgi:hypothetical protein
MVAVLVRYVVADQRKDVVQMPGRKETVAVSILLLCGLLSDGQAQSNPQDAPKPDAGAVLARVRETYRNLRSYHFERILLVQEAGRDGTLATLAELTLTTATENATSRPDVEMAGINLDRFRLGTKTGHGEMLQLCDGRTCWSYTSMKNEYMTGQTFRDVNSSVAGSMMLGLHLFTSSTVGEGVAPDASIIREEEIEVGGQRRSCYVIEGQVQPTPHSRTESKPPNLASLGVWWLASMVRLQGLAEPGRVASYWPWPDENATGVGQSTTLTLWIDQHASVIVRSKMSAELYKLRADASGEAGEKVALTAAENFTVAALGAPPDDVFRFTPPEGASEVPNVASRRNSK